MAKILKILKNFYFVFSVCLLAVLVVGGAYVFKYAKEQNMKKMALYAPSVYVENEENVTASSNKEDVKKETERIPQEEIVKSPKAEVEQKTMAILNEEFLIELPVKGSILNKFTKDTLVYSKTFDDYRVHNGIDIKCERSEAVFAVYDGVVEEIYADAMEGIVIIINHGNGYKSIYKNLSSDKMVKKGESVKKGQVISGAGETAIFEASEESHIHFELLKDGQQVNPEEYLKA